jgi:hypothetical protein
MGDSIPEEKIAEINHCDGMIRTNSLLGYPTCYDTHNRLTRLVARKWQKLKSKLVGES